MEQKHKDQNLIQLLEHNKLLADQVEELKGFRDSILNITHAYIPDSAKVTDREIIDKIRTFKELVDIPIYVDNVVNTTNKKG